VLHIYIYIYIYDISSLRVNASIVVIRNQSALREAEEHKPEAKDRPMPVSKLTEELGRIQAGLMVADDTDWKGWRRCTTKHWITSILVCFWEITKEKQVSESPEISVRVLVIFRDSCIATCVVGLWQ